MKSFIPNLRHLRAFREVARCQSISQASPIIFLSQPAITQAIAKLESTLGILLFERRNDGMFVTTEGNLFLDRVNRALNLIKAGVKESAIIGLKKNANSIYGVEKRITNIQLRALIAVADAGNFSLAARSIGITQPSLHRAARDLEFQTGIVLFVKSRHGIELTLAAKPLVLCAKLAFAELLQGIGEIAEFCQLDSSEIIIGTMPLARSYILPKAIIEHTKKHPEAKIKVVDGPYDDLLHSLRHGELDFLLGALRSPNPVEDVFQEGLFEESHTLVVRRDHPLVKQKNVSVSDLAQYPWIVPPKKTPTRVLFENLFREKNIVCPNRIVETSSFILLRSLLLASDRIAIVSTHQVIVDEKVGLIHSLPLNADTKKRLIGITVRRDWRPTASQNEFLNLLRRAGKTAEH